MSDGRLRAYYWDVFTTLAEVIDLLDPAHPDYSFPSEDEVEYTSALHATLTFQGGSRLIVHSWLDTTAGIREYDYAYIYLDAEGKRVFQYDDAPHHPGLSTHPHHVHEGPKPAGPDEALPLDIPQVNCVAVLGRVHQHLRRAADT